jgi:hypothetical protein
MAFTAPKPVAVPKTGIGFVDAMTTSAPAVTGFRMAGRYLGNSGLTLEFENDAVILDCGKAHAKSPYVVENEPAGFVVRVQNGGGAFPLSVAPDNTLRGSGATSVNGKLVASIRGDIVNFTPHSESCNVGTFSARSKRNTMRALSGPIPTVPPDNSTAPMAASAAPPVVQPASSTASVAAADRAAERASDQRVPFRVLLGSSFSGTNPLAGQTVFVMRKPIGSVLRELGVSVPANAGPGEAMKSLQTLCHSPQGCTPAVQGMSRYYVAATKLDASGRATLSAHTETGTYFFFAIVPSSSDSLVWDIAASLAEGDNNVMFSRENAQEIH